MRINKKRISLILVLAMISTIFTGCGFVDSLTVAKIGDKTLTYGVANLYARDYQQQYESYYGSSGSDNNFWSKDPESDQDSMEDTTKDSIMTNLKNMHILEAHMKDMKVKLSKKEKQTISKKAKKMVKANSKEAKNKFSITYKNVKRLLTLLTIQSKMHQAMIKDVDTKVEDKDCIQRKMHYVEFEFDSNYTEANNASETAEVVKDAAGDDSDKKDSEDQAKSKAEELQKTLEEGKVSSDNIEDLVKKASYEAKTLTFDSTTADLDADVMKDANAMKAGELKVSKGSNKYFLMYLDSENDKEATDQKREDIIKGRQDDAYSKQLEKWDKKTKYKLRKFVWSFLDFEYTAPQMSTK